MILPSRPRHRESLQKVALPELELCSQSFEYTPEDIKLMTFVRERIGAVQLLVLRQQYQSLQNLEKEVAV